MIATHEKMLATVAQRVVRRPQGRGVAIMFNNEEDSASKELAQLWDTADALWTRHQKTPAFDAYVSADYELVYETLKTLRGRICTFLEWGSGLGVVTIMASRLGFDAYGIEVEEQLVDFSLELARQYAPNATFATGSFIPDEYRWTPEYADDLSRTSIDSADAYDQLDMELRDFDLVFAYPWPQEQSMYHTIMREFGGPNSLYLNFDSREGTSLSRLGRGRQL